MNADIAREIATQHARDLIPCEKCGGDRLRIDYSGIGPCHAAYGREVRE